MKFLHLILVCLFLSFSFAGNAQIKSLNNSKTSDQYYSDPVVFKDLIVDRLNSFKTVDLVVFIENNPFSVQVLMKPSETLIKSAKKGRVSRVVDLNSVYLELQNPDWTVDQKQAYFEEVIDKLEDLLSVSFLKPQPQHIFPAVNSTEFVNNLELQFQHSDKNVNLPKSKHDFEIMRRDLAKGFSVWLQVSTPKRKKALFKSDLIDLNISEKEAWDLALKNVRGAASSLQIDKFANEIVELKSKDSILFGNSFASDRGFLIYFADKMDWDAPVFVFVENHNLLMTNADSEQGVEILQSVSKKYQDVEQWGLPPFIYTIDRKGNYSIFDALAHDNN